MSKFVISTIGYDGKRVETTIKAQYFERDGHYASFYNVKGDCVYTVAGFSSIQRLKKNESRK